MGTSPTRDPLSWGNFLMILNGIESEPQSDSSTVYAYDPEYGFVFIRFKGSSSLPASV